MDKIRSVLEFIISLVTTWKIIFPLLLVVFAGIGNLFDLGKKTLHIDLPLWIVVIILLLAFYPIARILVYVVNRRKQPLTEHYGLLWKKPFLPFGYPQPYCPRENCGKKVLPRITNPKSFQLMKSASDWNNVDVSNHYWYECPIHGRLPSVPDEEAQILKKKVKLILKK